MIMSNDRLSILNKASDLVKYAQTVHPKGCVLSTSYRPHTETICVWLRYKTDFSYKYEYTFEAFANIPNEEIYNIVMEDFMLRLKEIDSWNAGGV